MSKPEKIGYIAIDLSGESIVTLNKLFSKYNLEYTKEYKLHVTLVYSLTNVYINTDIFKNIVTPVYANVNGYKMFGENNDILVLTFGLSKLNQIHNYLLDNTELKHSYDEYTPHMTLWYSDDKVDYNDERVKQLLKELMGMKLSFKDIKYNENEDIKDEE